MGRVRVFYFIYRRTPQGSRNGPFSWAVRAAQAGRLAQSVFIEKSPPQTMAMRRNLSLANRLLSRYSLRLNIYVDDPLAATRGTRAQRARVPTHAFSSSQAAPSNEPPPPPSKKPPPPPPSSSSPPPPSASPSSSPPLLASPPPQARS